MKKKISQSVFLSILTALVSLALVSYLTKTLSLEDFGKYQLVMTFIGVLYPFSISGINPIINREILNGNDCMFKRLFKRTIVMTMALFALISMLFFITDHYINYVYGDLFLIALFFLPLIGIEKFEPVMYAKQKFINVRLLSLFTVITHAILAVTLLSYNTNYVYVFVSFFFAKLIFNIYGVIYCRSILLCYEKIDTQDKNNLIEGIKLSVLNIYNAFIGYLDRIIIGVIDLELLAVYSIAILIPMRIKDQLRTVLDIFLQKWGSEGEAVYNEHLNRSMFYYFIILVILCSLLAYLANFYIPLFFTQKYLDGMSVVWLMFLSVPFIMASHTMASYIIFFHNTVYYQRITYSKQAVYVLALVLLISDYGIFGVALAFFIRSVYTLLMTIMYYKRIRYGDA